ncbi:imidazole glycerol phosphate synthase subunit HisH [Egicoccus sp. AB-alg2]|uniref:imidazole glycerol phosphate synthase subunit HisH n=1 Tax=Egicoccus sp. AB-alg2 TaxID=3242693 RepID=UPI00359E02D7
MTDGALRSRVAGGAERSEHARRHKIAVLDYDAGNVRSAKHGFEAAGADPFITSDPDAAAEADGLVVPGVGHFGACLASLRRSGLHGLLEDWIAAQKPVFGICVGMQLLYESSDEGDEPGLGLLAGRVERFPTGAVVPHMGWDVLHAADGHDDDPLLRGVAGERVYYVHSYYAVPTDETPVVGRTAYGGVDFPSLVRQSSVVGTQFHPEKSGEIGRRLLANWVATLAA